MKLVKHIVLLFVVLNSHSTLLFSQIIESQNTIVLENPNPTNRKVIGVASPTTENDALNLKYFLSGKINFALATGSNDTLILDLSINSSALLPGTQINFISPITNSGNTVIKLDTFSSFYPITKKGVSSLDTSDIVTNQFVSILFDGERFQIISQLNNSCPSGFVKVTEEYCITPSESDSVYFWNAIKSCGDVNARVCNWGEWYYACTKRNSLGLVGMIGNYEWVDGGGNSIAGAPSTGLMSGETACTDITTSVVETTFVSFRSNPKRYRCCYSLRKND